MGNIHRIKKHMVPSIAMADTHVEINGCRVFLGHINQDKALVTAKSFRSMLDRAIVRSRYVNLHDIYEASLVMRKRMESGWN
ncbi:MAG: hypothetical protein ACYSSI_00130 [Planctomycetota bacterium]|jgi:hypothetical protein